MIPSILMMIYAMSVEKFGQKLEVYDNNNPITLTAIQPWPHDRETKSKLVVAFLSLCVVLAPHCHTPLSEKSLIRKF